MFFDLILSKDYSHILPIDFSFSQIYNLMSPKLIGIIIFCGMALLATLSGFPNQPGKIAIILPTK